jgi:hypothetical protein
MRRTATFDRCRRIVNGLHEYKTGSVLAPGTIAIGLDSLSCVLLANGEFHQYKWYVPSLNSLNIFVLPVALQPRTDDDRPARKVVQVFRSNRDAALRSRNCHRRCNFEAIDTFATASGTGPKSVGRVGRFAQRVSQGVRRRRPRDAFRRR